MRAKTPLIATPTWPMRINKYLAHTKHSTRVGADVLIREGKVFINGRRAILGDKVVESDEVEVKGGAKRAAAYVYYAYHKPRGVITHSPQEVGEKDIKKLIEKTLGLKDTFPVGRLDKDSSGLIILTNDGRVTDRLLNPEYDHTKEYLVRTREKLRDSFKDHMEKGVMIEGYLTRPVKIKILGEKSFVITLTEGKKHQIRRMVVAMHNDVKDLERAAIMNIRLGSLPPGMWRRIEGDELKGFLNALGL